jgi:exonuclease SbcD
MKIIHTSDWHIGLELYEHDRLEEQSLFLEWLLTKCIENSIDALIISGDVYDVTNPSVNAQTLFSNFVVEFKSKLPKASIVVIGGNHDSGNRMEISRSFGQALGGIHFIGSLNHEDPNLLYKHVIPLTGPNDESVAWCLPVPFLRPSDLDCKLQETETADQAFNRSITEIYNRLRLHAISLNPNLPIIAMGHLTAMGSEKSGSERILIGGVDSVPAASISEGMDYVALGHIHKAQAISVKIADAVDKIKIQYCGSPLSMNFDERKYEHKVLLVEISKVGETPKITTLLIPQLVEFIRFSETLKNWDQVEAEINNFDWSKWKDTPKNLWPFIDIQFLAEGGLGDLRNKTEALIKKFPFRLAGPPRSIMAIDKDLNSISGNNLTEIDLKSEESPLTVFQKYFAKKHGQQLPDEIKICFEEILSETLIQGKK